MQIIRTFTCYLLTYLCDFSHRKKFHMWKLLWVISHVNFHMRWMTYKIAQINHIRLHLWNITCDLSHMIFPMWNFTLEISHVKFHMWNFTCGISHVKFHMWNTCEKSHMKFHMWNTWLSQMCFTCENTCFGTSHVKHMCYFCKGLTAVRCLVSNTLCNIFVNII